MLKMIGKRLKDQRGLTLVELLAVVVILGIISAIAVPSIGGLIDKTKKDAQVAEAIQIVNAAKLYVTSHPKAQTLTKTHLGEYLDNIKDDGEDYEVVVTKSSTSSKFEFAIQKHDAGAVVSTGTTALVKEADLLGYSTK